MAERVHEKYQRLLEFCKTLPPTPTAVAHPCDESSIRGALDAAKLGLIQPILVGPRARIEAAAQQADIDISRYEIVDAPYSEASAARAVELVRALLADERIQRAKPSMQQLSMIEHVGETLQVAKASGVREPKGNGASAKKRTRRSKTKAKG